MPAQPTMVKMLPSNGAPLGFSNVGPGSYELEDEKGRKLGVKFSKAERKAIFNGKSESYAGPGQYNSHEKSVNKHSQPSYS